MAVLQTPKIKAAQTGIIRKSNFGLTVISLGIAGIVAVTSFILPPVAAAINHTVDRVTNGIKSRREMKARMNWYRLQIAQTLGISPDKVTLSDFKTAASMNPVLASAINDISRTEAKENRNSVLVNGASAFIPGAGVAAGATTVMKVAAGAKTLGKQIAASTGAGMLLDWMGKSHINSQEVIEGIAGQYNAALENGINPRQVVTPQLLFLLRVSQDSVLAQEIKSRYGKAFQQLTDEQRQTVMLDYKPLADAVTSEAYAVAQGIMPVQELMVRAPNLKSNADRYAIGPSNSSFVEALQQQRQRAAMQANSVAG